MTSKKPRQGAKKATDKASSPGARSKTEIKKVRAEIAESERRTLNRMEFIVEHQAQFVTDLGELKGSLSRLENIVGRLADATLARFEESDAKHDEATEKFAALVDAQIRTEESVKKTDEKFAALVDAQIRTEERSQKTDETITALVDAQIRTEESVKKTDEKFSALVDAQIRAEETVKKTNEKFTALVDAQIGIEESVKKTNEKFAALVDAQIRTEETVKKTSEEVRSLASTVDRYLSERRNGN